MSNKRMMLQTLLLLGCIYTFAASITFSGAKIIAVSANCNSDSEPCGSGLSCCQPGFKCNFLRGIPVCYSSNETSLSGFDMIPCADPYTIRCDDVVGVTGSCCPIGSICRVHGTSQAVECINAFGETQSSIPSATTTFVPSTTAITEEAVYSPSHAWSTSSSGPNCTTSKALYATSTINATITINYTGPSIMINTVTSPKGGVFSVLVDGFDIGTIIDTFVAPGDLSVPTCYPVQIPPFKTTPPDFGSRNDHTVSLIYIGASSDAPEGTESDIQIDSFAIPDHDNFSDSQLESKGDGTVIGAMELCTSVAIMVWIMMGLI